MCSEGFRACCLDFVCVGMQRGVEGVGGWTVGEKMRWGHGRVVGSRVGGWLNCSLLWVTGSVMCVCGGDSLFADLFCADMETSAFKQGAPPSCDR